MVKNQKLYNDPDEDDDEDKGGWDGEGGSYPTDSDTGEIDDDAE